MRLQCHPGFNVINTLLHIKEAVRDLNSDIDCRIFNVCTDVNACDCTRGRGGGTDTVRVFIETLTLAEKSLAPSENRTCVNDIMNTLSYHKLKSDSLITFHVTSYLKTSWKMKLDDLSRQNLKAHNSWQWMKHAGLKSGNEAKRFFFFFFCLWWVGVCVL